MPLSLDIKKVISLGIMLVFLVNIFGPVPMAQAQDFRLPAPGVMVHLSPPFDPPILKGIKVHPDNPFRFDFILDLGDERSSPSGGDSQLSNNGLKDESTKLIKYFLASLTIPEKDLWVNLSPYEKDRIIPNSFGLTEMGRDLLVEDYMLKQITASLIYPEDQVGKRFWTRIYEAAAKKYGTTDIPVNTFNKVWIVPEKAVVYENTKADTAYVVESKLKVMLEQDYLSLEKHEGVQSRQAQMKDTNKLGSQVVREVLIPELTKEINENKNFAKLRQVYNSLILATWYKKKIKDSILEHVYVDKGKVGGINIDDPKEKERIYQGYLQAFKKGVYNYIKVEQDPITQGMVPRKYFSGGVSIYNIRSEIEVYDPKTASAAMVSLINSAFKRPLAVILSSLAIVLNDQGMIISRQGMKKQMKEWLERTFGSFKDLTEEPSKPEGSFRMDRRSFLELTRAVMTLAGVDPKQMENLLLPETKTVNISEKNFVDLFLACVTPKRFNFMGHFYEVTLGKLEEQYARGHSSYRSFLQDVPAVLADVWHHSKEDPLFETLPTLQELSLLKEFFSDPANLKRFSENPGVRQTALAYIDGSLHEGLPNPTLGMNEKELDEELQESIRSLFFDTGNLIKTACSVTEKIPYLISAIKKDPSLPGFGELFERFYKVGAGAFDGHPLFDDFLKRFYLPFWREFHKMQAQSYFRIGDKNTIESAWSLQRWEWENNYYETLAQAQGQDHDQKSPQKEERPDPEYTSEEQEQHRLLAEEYELYQKDIDRWQNEGGSLSDQAMHSPRITSDISTPGGIDLNAVNRNLLVQNSSSEIKFHMDAAMLQQFQNASGLTVGSITIQPLKSLSGFLGVPGD